MSNSPASAAIESLLETLPSIKARWNEHREDWGGEVAGVFNDAGVIAHHLKELNPVRPSKNSPARTSEFDAFFSHVEELYIYDQSDVSEVLTVGLFEALQNITASEEGGWTRFEPWLGELSTKAWNDLITFWNNNAEQDAAGNPLPAE